MNMQEVTALTIEQLNSKLVETRKEQMNLRFQKATGTMENPNRWRELRKDVARMKTELTAKKTAQSSNGGTK